MTSNRWSKTTLLCSFVVLGGGGLASAQRATRAPAAAPAAPVAARPAETLDNLGGDDQLMSELANRGLDSLLARIFEKDSVPEAKQQGIKTLSAMAELTDPSKKLTNADKQKRVKQVVEGINAVLPTLNVAPKSLMQDANTLIEAGVLRDVNTLEYWGDNPVTQQRLKPVVQTVIDLLDKASKTADKDANAIVGKINAANQDTVGKKWQELDDLSHNAIYQQEMFEYYRALATSKTAPEWAVELKKIDKAVEFLKDLDSPDSGVQGVVRNMIAKLLLVRGDYPAAEKAFDAVINDKGEVAPPLTKGQIYEAKYFRLVAQLGAKDAAGAQKGLDELVGWQKANLPADKPTQDGVAAAAEMMRYRIHLLESQVATAPADKRKADDAAVDVLLKLSDARPDLRPIIYEQLVSRLPADKPVAELDPLLLQGLMNKGIGEANKPSGDKVDQKVVERALAAAREVIDRKDRKGIAAPLVEDASMLIPTLMDRQGKSVAAANAYLDYAAKFGASGSQASKDALDRAGYLTFQEKKKNPEDPAVSKLYDRLLEVAVNPPFSRSELAYAYAQRLRATQRPKEAVAMYRRVGKADPNYLNAQYFQMLTLQELLDTKMGPAERSQMVADVLKLAGTVKQLGSASAAPLDRFKAAHATLVAADSIRSDQNDPKQALAMLNGFETIAKGLPGENELVGRALFGRVKGYMALGQLNQATTTLVSLLDKAPDAGGMVGDLLQQLSKELDKAEAAHNTERVKAIVKDEAQLTGFLADWSKNNANPKIKDQYYQYEVFDARTKRIAGGMEDNPAERQKMLQDALSRYKALQSPENVALYKKGLDPKKVASGEIDASASDVAVQVGLAFVDYDLQDYKGAQAILTDLLVNKKLGSPSSPVLENGESVMKDNDLYWEATYKLLKSNVALSKDAVALEDTKKGLKNILIRGGIPAKWQDGFEELRKQLTPEFTVGGPAAPATQAALQK